MLVRFTSAANIEVAGALDWYAANVPRETGRFLNDFELLTRRLADNPRQFAFIEGETRRAGFRRFPYGLFFQIVGDEVWVFACLHASRDPGRGRGRV